MVWPFASRLARQPDAAASAEPRLPAYALTVELHRPFHAALRDVRFQLNADIDALGRSLKLVNIALMPLLLTVGVLLLWFWRRRKR